MRTEEDIREEYIKKLTVFSEEQDEQRKYSSNGELRDKTKTVNVTEICVWDTYCPKQVYYDKTDRRPAKPEALVRFTLGNVAHEIPLWDSKIPEENGHEQAFSWNGLRCRMDEINFKEGIIVDKKTTPALSVKAKPYVTKQLNIYKVIAENNTERPTKINQLFVINLVVVNGKIQVLEVPIWETRETIEFIERVRNEILTSVQNRIVPAVEYGSKAWMCENCQYTDVCARDSPSGVHPIVPKQAVFEEEPISGIKVKVSKKKK